MSMHPPLNWEALVISWGPMLILIAVWLFFLTRMRKGNWQTAEQKEQAETLKAATRALERITAALEKRSF
jgi:cytochrome c-type biogenesis protein CcmH/NrfF